jgi:ATP-dependent Lon protease
MQPLVPAQTQPAATSLTTPEAAIALVEPEAGLATATTPSSSIASAEAELSEQHFTIHYGDTGHSYESIVLPYLRNARTVTIEDPYIRATHQVQNFVRFCEAVIKVASVRNVVLITSYDETTNLQELAARLDELKQSLLELDVALDVKVNENLHDREIRIDNGWTIKIGRGLDFFQKPDSWFGIGANDISLRRCLETKVDIFKTTVI